MQLRGWCVLCVWQGKDEVVGPYGGGVHVLRMVSIVESVGVGKQAAIHRVTVIGAASFTAHCKSCMWLDDVRTVCVDGRKQWEAR